MGQIRPFAWSSRAPSSPSPADILPDNHVVALGPTLSGQIAAGICK
jgi:hypothetical protein